MKIGLIVAIETDAVFEHYPHCEALDCPPGFSLYKTQSGQSELYILRTGMGEIAAACGTQYLITRFAVEVIVNFGVVGGLAEDMKKQKVCVVERVVHYKYDCSEFMELAVGQVAEHDSPFLSVDQPLLEMAMKTDPSLRKVTCCSGDKFVGTEAEKRRLHLDFEGDVCDMESAGIVLTCEANGVPCLLFKAVSDGLSGGAREFYEELRLASLVCLRTADAIISGMS